MQVVNSSAPWRWSCPSLYLSRQVQQNTRALRTANAATVQQNFQAIARAFITDRDAAAVVIRALQGDETLSPPEKLSDLGQPLLLGVGHFATWSRADHVSKNHAPARAMLHRADEADRAAEELGRLDRRVRGTATLSLLLGVGAAAQARPGGLVYALSWFLGFVGAGAALGLPSWRTLRRLKVQNEQRLLTAEPPESPTDDAGAKG